MISQLNFIFAHTVIIKTAQVSMMCLTGRQSTKIALTDAKRQKIKIR